MTANRRSGPAANRRARRRFMPLLPRVLVGAVSGLLAAGIVGSGLGLLPSPSDDVTVVADGSPAAVPPDQVDERSDGADRASRSSRPQGSTDADPRRDPAADDDSAADEPAEEPPPAKDEPEPEESPQVPGKATGELHVVDGQTPTTLTADRVINYRVEVEDGLPFNDKQVAACVHEVLDDDRGWSGVHSVAFNRTTSEDAELRVIVASPDLTDTLCLPLLTGGEVSCRVDDRVVLNAKRWAYGVPDYEGELEAYRTYLVNHEVGHALGYDHATCPGPGEPAPVMMQQTKGVGDCAINPWPTVALS